MRSCGWFVLMLSLAVVGVASARSGEEIYQAIGQRGMHDDIRWLKDSGRRFMTIRTENRYRTLRGAVLLLHDRGGHPDWPEVIQPLRSRLPDCGWITLSVAIPSLPEDPLTSSVRGRFKKVTERVDAALAEFKDAELDALILVGHGWGARAALYYLANNSATEINGLVMVGVSEPPYTAQEFSLGTLLGKIEVPVLDIYGERDWRSARQAGERRAHAENGDVLNYQQLALSGARHGFRGQEEALVKRIRGWMQVNSSEISKAGDQAPSPNVPAGGP